MSAATYIGRIGALAAALGVGTAVLTGTAVARADRGPSDTAGSSATESSGSEASTSATPTGAHRQGSRAPRTPSTDDAAPASTRGGGTLAIDATVDAAPEPAAATIPDAPRRGGGAVSETTAVALESAPTPTMSTNEPLAVAEADPELPAPDGSAAPAPVAALETVTPVVEPVESIADAVKAPAAQLKSTPAPPTGGIPAALAGVADRISAAITSVVANLAHTFGTSPFAPPVESPADWALLAAVRRQPAAATTSTSAAATAAVATGPTLFVLDGYNVVAASPKLVTSFYGPFVNFPAYPGTQSEQQFNLVDPATQQVAGSFKALQSTLYGIGITRQLVVTDVLSGNADIIAPVGSVISSSDNLGFGTLYTATPSASGTKVSFKIVSPFGDIPLPFPYDAAKGLTDYGEVNKPMLLENGLTIAPTTPSSEKFTAVTGLQPLFSAIQGIQHYTVYDAKGAAVGSFEGMVTTTSDALGLFTKEIQVTKVGPTTNPNVPTVGTVYNLIDVSDKLYALYSSTPSANGTAISIQVVTPFGSTSIPFNLNASTPPPLPALRVPNGGYKFVPTSAQQTVGINGLPPREMITQGYQQFDVVDALGNKIGSVDADVMRQWDWMGGTSNAILITKVNSGTAGPLPWNVPPVGSVFNFRQTTSFNLGFSDYYSSIPTVLGDVVTYGTVTPFGLIPMYLPNYLSGGLKDAVYVDPFAVTA